MINDNKIGVITTSFGLIKANYENVSDEFLAWQNNILRKYGYFFEKNLVHGSYCEVLIKLFPLVSHIGTKYLFVPTISEWTAYFDNGWQGTDPSALPVLSKLMNTEALRIVCVEHTMPDKVTKESVGRYGATILEIYNNGETTRTIYATHDGRKWIFGQVGDPLEFEDTAKYKSRNIKDRFNKDISKPGSGLSKSHS